MLAALRRMHGPVALGLILLTALLACSSPPTPTTADGVQRGVIEWRFVGDASFHDFELRRVVEDQLIVFERRREATTLFDASLDLQDFYESKGFPRARVRYELEERSDPVRTRVTFAIQEGPRAYVEALRLDGCAAIPAEELEELWSRERSGLLATGRPYFVASGLRVFRYAMIGYYRDRGFLDVKVRGPIEKPSPASKADESRVDMLVRFEIDEGKRFVLTQIDVDSALLDALPGARAPAQDELLGAPFRAAELANYRELVRKALLDHGYPEPDLNTSREIDRSKPGAPIVRARIRGKAGPRRRVRAVRIEGNDRTSSSVIAARLRFEPGQFYCASKIEETLRELYMSGLFSRVTIERAETEDENGDLLRVVLEEVAAREFGFLVGYGSYERARTRIVLADQNLFGIGQSLRLGAKLSERSHGVDLTFTEPRLFGTHTSWATTAFLRQREEPSFEDESTGVSSVFMRRIFRACQARVGYSIEDRDGSDIDASLRALVLEEFVVAKLFAELRYDDRDSSIAPRSGGRVQLRYEYASPELGGDLRFTRGTLETAWHATLREGVVLSLAARAGAIWARSADELPVQERFFRGGDTTVRSYREAQLGPRSTDGRPSGGSYFTNFNAELRFPLLGPLEGAGFVDAANVGREVEDFGLSRMRYALGGGLRFLLPIGPVRLDYAWNPDAEENERDSVLHLSVGYPF